jgi:hypothetical protein
MRFSYLDLTTAVDHGNVARLQEILRDRDRETGRPSLDINGIRDGVFTNNLLGYLIRKYPDMTSDATREMILSILNVRDNQNNLVINLNMPCCNSSLMDYFFNWYRTTPQRQQNETNLNFLAIVDAIVNARDPYGNRALDLTLTDHILSPLKTAVYLQDTHLVRLLLDLRNADGLYAINVNMPSLYADKTTLDIALTGDYGNGVIPNFVPNRVIVRMLEERQAVRFSSFTPGRAAALKRVMQDERDALFNRRAGLFAPIVRIAPPVRAAAPAVRDPIPRAAYIIRPPVVVVAPIHAEHAFHKTDNPYYQYLKRP